MMAVELNVSIDCTTAEKWANFSIWDELKFKESFNEIIFGEQNFGIDFEQSEGNIAIEDERCKAETELSVSTKHSCSACKLDFTDFQQQAAHFKTDLHILNLKRTLQGKEPVTTENLDSDLEESDSSSESESEAALEAAQQTKRHPQLIFENKYGDRLLIYKGLLLARRETPTDCQDLISRVKQLPKSVNWAVMLLSAGHFAAAVFEKNSVIAQKTFHRYTTRRKQGTAQGTHDHHGGRKAKSAGASLRRYNELALTEDITCLMQSWQPLLSKCSHVFYRACGSSRGIIFGGKKPIFSMKDTRFRRIPFPTKRPKHEEVVRVHSLLSNVEYLHDTSDITGMKKSVPTKSASPKKGPTTTFLKENASSLPEEENTPKDVKSDPKKKEKSKRQENPNPKYSDGSETSDSEEYTLHLEEMTEMTSDLKPFGFSKPKKWKANLAQEKLAQNAVPSTNRIDDFYTACKLNNIDMAKTVISSIQDKTRFLNTPLSQDNTTFLHIASQSGAKELLWLLLEHGADPTIKNGKGQLPYIAALNKETRNTFKTFVIKYPNKFRYGDAQIPTPLPAEDEQAKLLKKQKQRQEKRLRSKENKMMQEEKSKFLALTNYEKTLWFKNRGMKMRCFQCGEIISEIPFEYNDIKCCSMNCILEHKKAK